MSRILPTITLVSVLTVFPASLSKLHAQVANHPLGTKEMKCGVLGIDPLQQKVRTRGNDEDNTKVTDGIYRVMRLAVFMSAKEYNSDKFNRDYNKIKAFWTELETYLNSIYVRDFGLQFKVIKDERLVEKTYHRDYTYQDGTPLINAAIGIDNYDIGIVLDYSDSGGMQGLASVGAIVNDTWKASGIVINQSMPTIAHELGHLLGSNHPFTQSQGMLGYGTEPGSGQSIISYGSSSEQDFVSLECLKKILHETPKADYRLVERFPNTTNTAPHIDRERMKDTYVVPEGTFFSIPVYATDQEQKTLHYTFNQYGCTPQKPAHFPVYAPQQSNVIDFGVRYNGTGAEVTNSRSIPVGDYRFWFSVSDALPIEEAMQKHQAPLYDSYIANIKVVKATPFKLTTTIDNHYEMGDLLHLTWTVDKSFFRSGSKVRVLMSDDMGHTFRHVLLPSTDNDGTCDVFIPQRLMKRVPTYTYVVPETGERIDIYFASEGLLRIETIGDDIRYYDISNNSKNGGGIEVTKAEVEFSGVPEETYITIGKNDEMPPKPNITASVQGQMVPVTYTETTDDNLTTRTWTVKRGGKTSGVQLFIERRKTDTAGNTPDGISTTKASDAINITTYKGQITLTGTKTGTLVGIYNTAGMLVKSMMSKGDELHFTNLPSGIYIIKVGEEELRKVQITL